MTIPPFLIDPATLPPPLMNSELGSFAQNTLKVRIPGIIDETLRLNSFPPDVVRAIQELRSEILSGAIRGLQEFAPDRAFWDEASREYIGRTWLDVPWYWSEAFFYRRMLEATGYFQPGPLEGVDPYAEKKKGELAPDVAPRAVAATLREVSRLSRADAFRVLVHASLWGNRVDLSYNVADKVGRAGSMEQERENLIVDDTNRVWDYVQGGRGECALIADNAGTELCHDLALVDRLLQDYLFQRVTLHLKAQPFYVSDAMPSDVEEALAAFERSGGETRALAERLNAARRAGRFARSTHWFFTSSLFYFQLPRDLYAELARADLVILKGDANYRRLEGDAHWPFTTPFGYTVRYFPAPLCALRTLKAETIVGLAAGQAERERALDPGWLVDGRRGVAQARLERGTS